MTRIGEDYIRGLRDGRTVLFDGDRVADVSVPWEDVFIYRNIELTAGQFSTFDRGRSCSSWWACVDQVLE